MCLMNQRFEEMTVPELRELYARVFGEETRSRHKDYLRKRIAWRQQANEHGGLSERALARAHELANDADLRLLGRTVTKPFAPKQDRRLPIPGTVLTRVYKGETLVVTVLPSGFEVRGTVYRSLTAIAKAVTGSHWNGQHFFGIGGKP